MSHGLLRILGGAAVLTLLVAAFSPTVNLLSYWMAPTRRSEPAQAIVVLGAGGVAASGTLTDPSMRGTMDGILLYQKGLAPIVVFSGSPEGIPKGEAETRADLARACGIPESAILTSSKAHTTSEEAQEIRGLLMSRQIRKIMLVADTPGMGRAMRVFEQAGFDVVPSPWSEALDLGGPPEGRLGLLRQLSIEMLARLYYRIAGYM